MERPVATGAHRSLVAACAHPVAIGAAVLIVVNDLVLRRLVPGWWTGKLSDAGWLVVAPVLLAAGLSLVGVVERRARGIALVGAGMIFTALQLWPPLGAWFSPAHIADAEDLVVLPALGVALLAWGNRWRGSRAAGWLGVPVLVGAMVATSYNVAPPAASWPCGGEMEWNASEPMRFRLQSFDDVWVDSDQFTRGIELLDAAGERVPVIVTAASEADPPFAVCARDGLLPDSEYTWRIGPWSDVQSNELSTGHSALPTVRFRTTEQQGVAVDTPEDCGALARSLQQAEYDACNIGFESDTGDTAGFETGEFDTGDSGEAGDGTVIAVCLALVAGAEEPLPRPMPGPGPGAAWKDDPSPEGFRVGIDGDRTAVQTRVAVVKDLDGALLTEETLRGQFAWRRLGFSVEMVAATGQSDVWASAGLGNARVAFDVRFGRRDTHALGLAGRLPVGGWARGDDPQVAWWGTVPRATLPVWGLALFYAGSSRTWTWRTQVGVEDMIDFGVLPSDLSAAVAWVQPVAPGWSVVSEAELELSPSPFQLRFLARRDLDAHWRLDLGTALPVPMMVFDPTVQLLAQVQRVW